MFTYMHTNGIRAELHSEGATITPTSLYDPVVRINLEEFSAIRAAILDNLGFWRGENTGCLVVAKPNPNNQHLFVDPARLTCGWVNREALGRYLDVVPPALPYLEPGEVWEVTLADGPTRVQVSDRVDFLELGSGRWIISPLHPCRRLMTSDGKWVGVES